MNAGDYAMAQEINSSILPVNTIEENWRLTNTIYLNSVTDDGSLVINDTDYAALNEIAMLDGGENGFGIYNARGMTGTEIYSFEEEEEDERSIQGINSVKIYPNPSSNYIYITNINTFDNIVQIILNDISGSEILSTSNKDQDCRIDVTHLESGIYLLKILNYDRILSNEKIIITK